MEILTTIALSVVISSIIVVVALKLLKPKSNQPFNSLEIEKLQLKIQQLESENEQLKAQRLLKSKHEEVEKLLWNARKLVGYKNKLRVAIDQLQIDTTSKEKIIKELDKEKLKAVEWSDITERFNHSFPSFMENFKAQYPDLSSNDLRLLMLIKMDLNTKEIAAVLNLSEKSAEIAKYRLRKKLDLPKSKNINQLISQLSK